MATGLSAERDNRAISPGAVRNNMTKAAAAGQLLLVSENPLKFVYLAPQPAVTDEASPDGDDTSQAAEPDTGPDDADGADSATGDEQ